jgi:hypothetical protein
LIIIGNPVVLSQDPNWKAMLQYCILNKAYVGVPYSTTHIESEEDKMLDAFSKLHLEEKSDDEDEEDDLGVSHTTAQEEPEWRSEY